jgi:hypothetical protein
MSVQIVPENTDRLSREAVRGERELAAVQP